MSQFVGSIACLDKATKFFWKGMWNAKKKAALAWLRKGAEDEDEIDDQQHLQAYI
jgi:hypothetical protein